MSDPLLPLDRLEPWLKENLVGFEGPVSASKFSGGQSNPTYMLETPQRRYVLRRKPAGVLLKSAHAVDREFRVQRALENSAVPVAKMHILCEDDAVIGAMFYIMDLVEGDSYQDPRLPDFTVPERKAMMDDMNRVLAALHDIDLNAFGLSDFGPSGNYYERQIGRWTKQYHASETGPLLQMDQLIGALGERLPEDDGQRTLVHGDFRLDNLIFKNCTCRAVLDWELSTLGHPFADLAAVTMQWQMPTGPEGRGLAGVDRDALGLPSDEAFVDAYCTRRNLPPIRDFGFYQAFCFFRMAAILQGVKKRAMDGNAADPEKGLAMGRHIPMFASLGLEALAK